VSHLVPGQEEGNIALIERLGVGAQALGGPEKLAEVARETFANDGRIWRGWKQNLDKLDAADAGGRIARFLLDFQK
jgi:processive 1,2-diacylglycerol beta-glucosyltransferase